MDGIGRRDDPRRSR